MMQTYIEKNIELKKDYLIFFSKKDYYDAEKYLNSLTDVKIQHTTFETNVSVSCRSYPERYTNCHRWNPIFRDYQCQAEGYCLCEDYCPISQHYQQFSWENEYMIHYDQCYDDRCSISNAFIYITVFLNYPDDRKSN